MAYISISNKVRRDNCRHNRTVERRQINFGLSHQPNYCNQPYYPTAWFRPTSSHNVSTKLLADRSRSMSCITTQLDSQQMTVNSRTWRM